MEKTVQEAKDILLERISNNEIDLFIIKEKCVLNSGCGSGRYSCALGLLGAEEVIGVDFFSTNFYFCKKYAKLLGLNVKFSKMS